MIVINFYAGPGAGKSTTAATVFAKLKNEGIKVEMAREVAKDFIYEGREVQLGRNQVLVSGMQYARLRDLAASGTDVAISDSPLLLGVGYAEAHRYFDELKHLMKKLDSEFYNVNVWVKRATPYQTFGRLQNEQGAKELDRKLYDFGQPYAYECNGDEAGQHQIANQLVYNPLIQRLRGTK